MILNREVFFRDPLSVTLPNDGVAKVQEPENDQQWEVVRHELSSFVCEGEYHRGLDRILSSYLRHLGEAHQPAAWVSGFYGSGKSHLVRVLEFLWRDVRLPGDASARGLVELPADVTALLRELSTVGRREGGLWSAAGTLSAGDADSVRLAMLSILFRSAGLPEQYPTARFVLWLAQNGYLDAVKASVEGAGRDFNHELRQLYVSPHLAKALLQAFPQFAASEAEARGHVRAQFPPVSEITDEQFIAAMEDVLRLKSTAAGKLPCTLVVLDELQQYVGQSPERAMNVQTLVETCVSRFQSRLLFVATGQSALQDTAQLQKLQGRFTVRVQLSDVDVETVIRRVVLRKAPDRVPQVEAVLAQCSGEIDRHLQGTRIAPTPADRDVWVADYPLLPARRRFWERVLRALDKSGVTAQLRNQLRVVHEGNQRVAKQPLGTVIAGDVLYDQLAASLLQTPLLSRDVDQKIKEQRKQPDGELRSRLCALVFLISQIPDDAGIRATADTLADLLVENLVEGSSGLRQRIPPLLAALVEDGTLMQLGDEFRLQTREGQEWERTYRTRYTQILDDDGRIASERAERFKKECEESLRGLTFTQGASKAPRKLDLHFGAEAPRKDTGLVPVWIRDEWSVPEATVRQDAQAEGSESPLVFVFLPRRSADVLKAALAGQAAARETLDVRGAAVSTTEGREARAGMETRLATHTAEVSRLVAAVLADAAVLLGGGTAVPGDTLRDRLKNAADAAIVRLFPQFGPGDHAQWNKVAERARQGAADALSAIGYTGEADKYPACQLVLAYVGVSGKKGSDVRQYFQNPPFGWTGDAVDGALLAQVAGGYVRASLNAQPAVVKQLDRPTLGKAEFRREGAVITALHRIAARKLLSDAGIPISGNDEAAALPLYVAKLIELARGAGGEPPLPAAPASAHLEALRMQAGNELVLAVYEQREALEAQRKEWTARKTLVEKRLPRWQVLERLAAHAAPLAAGEVTPQVEAVRRNRALLAEPDPIPPLCGQLADLLRAALQKAQSRYAAVRDAKLADLARTDVWDRLSDDQWRGILADHGLGTVPEIRVGTEAEVLESLARISLPDWETRTAGLPERFAQALLAASRLLEPKAVRVTLPGGTLKTEQEVEEYLARVRALLMEPIGAGCPVVI